MPACLGYDVVRDFNRARTEVAALTQDLKEEVGGVVQGGVVKFPLAKLTSSAMRAQFNRRDGQPESQTRQLGPADSHRRSTNAHQPSAIRAGQDNVPRSASHRA